MSLDLVQISQQLSKLTIFPLHHLRASVLLTNGQFLILIVLHVLTGPADLRRNSSGLPVAGVRGGHPPHLDPPLGPHPR